MVIAAGLCLWALAALAGGPDGWTEPLVAAAVQPHEAGDAQPQAHAAAGEAGSHEAQSPWALVARLFNFAVLAGTLVYFLRSPFLGFLANRGAEIRASLVKAAELRAKADRQIADVERRLAALPVEIAALEARGAEETTAEDARIRSAAEGERVRLVEQARRQIELQLRVARRELTAHAADRAVAVAAERIRQTIQDEDQRRLVDAYLTRLSAPPSVTGAGSGAPGGGRP